MANIHVRSMDERHVPNIGWFNQSSDQPILNLDALKLIKSDSSRKAQGTMAVNTGPRAPGPFVPNLGIIQFCLAPAGSWDPTTSPKVGFKIFKGRLSGSRESTIIFSVVKENLVFGHFFSLHLGCGQWIDLREKLQENSIFHREINGFL